MNTKKREEGDQRNRTKAKAKSTGVVDATPQTVEESVKRGFK